MAASGETSGESYLPEGCLVQKFHSALDTTCEKFVAGIKFSQMKEIYRDIYQLDSEKLRSCHNQLRSQLLDNLKSDIDENCENFGTDTLLNSLEEIQKKQESSQLSWRPSKNPKEDLRDHIHSIKLKYKSDLIEILKKLREENEELSNTVAVNHGEILLVKKSYDEKQEELSKILDALTGDPLQNIKKTAEKKSNELMQ